MIQRESFVKRASRSTKTDDKKKGTFEEWIHEAWAMIKKYLLKQPSVSVDKIELSIGNGKCHQKHEPSKEGEIKWVLDSKTDYNKIMSLPFEFIQKADGSVPEIRFSPKEKNEAVKNFKKHIADTFATQLDSSKNETFESSPIGQHISFYSFDPSREKTEDDFKLAGSALLEIVSSFFRSPSSSSSSLSSLSSSSDTSSSVNIVRNINSDDVLKVGRGKVLIHDRNQIDINARQIQQINQGHVTNTGIHDVFPLLLINLPTY